MSGAFIKQRLLIYQAAGFGALIVWSWLDETLNLPARLFGAALAGANILEAVEESIVIAIFGAMIIYSSYRLLNRIKLLEGIIPTCSFCKKMRVGSDWQSMEDYLSKRSDAAFSHGFCPSCLEENFGINEEEKKGIGNG